MMNIIEDKELDEIEVDDMVCYNCVNYTKEKTCAKRYESKPSPRTHDVNTGLKRVEPLSHCLLFKRKETITKQDNIIKIHQAPLIITNYIENVETFHDLQPFFYDKKGLFWFWQKKENKWEMLDEIDVMNGIDRNLGLTGQTVSTNTKNNYLEAFKRVGRMKMPKPTPSHWIQFKDTIFDLRTKKTLQATPEYYMCNPIPWKPGTTSKTPVIDKLFKEWVGERYIQTLYEIIAYCTTTHYPIHLAFCFVGSGRNGKTQFQQLLLRFTGMNNCCSTELDTLIDSRFETFKLYKKLVCQLGETNFGIMKKTSMFKKLTGGDFIGFEAKHKTPFNDYNYAKIIINSNSLPTSTDTSEGFYRRWLIIDFPNEFPEGKDIIDTIPDSEYECLARKCIDILPGLLDKGCFTNQGSIEERRQKYMLASNPFNTFLKLCCDVGDNDFYIKLSDLYNAYCQFLRQIKARVVSRKEFNTALNDEGFYAINTTRKVGVSHDNELNDSVFDKGWWIDGLKLKDDFTTITINTTRFSLSCYV